MSESVKQTIQRTLVEAMERTEKARRAERCYQVKANGVRCGSPAMRGGPFCYFHEQMVNRVPAPQFPPLEDANAVQCALMQVLEGVAAGSMDARVANTLIYGLQTAIANLKRVDFEPVAYEVVTEMPFAAPPRNSSRKRVESASATSPAEATGTE